MEYSHEEMHATYRLLTNHDSYHWKASGRLEALGVQTQEEGVKRLLGVN